MMMNKYLPFVLGLLPLSVAAAQPSTTLNIKNTYYGNAGGYKTSTWHPSLFLQHNVNDNLNFSLEWDRTWNTFDYNGGDKQQNNRFSAPKATINYTVNNLNGTKINFLPSLMIENEASFNGSNQTYTMLTTGFDFSAYIPKNDYISNTQFELAPIYIYGVSAHAQKGHVNTMALSLLTNWQLPYNFSFTLNAYAFKEFYNGSYVISNDDNQYTTANYFMVLAWLQYSKTLLKINEKTDLTFNFTGGLDPYIASNRNASWSPFLIGNQMYEWLTPTVTSGAYKNTYILFAEPQLALNYNLSPDLTLSIFGQVKYSNQVWGNQEKDWEWQPQGGVGVTYSF